MDGYHRADAVLEEADEFGTPRYLRAIIKPNCTYEEILDGRILNATLHETVQFARVIGWVEEAWKETEWHSWITAAQAFSVIVSGQKGQKFGMKPHEREAIAAWVARKCEQWSLEPEEINDNLEIGSIADPELVQQTRLRGAFTVDHISAIAKAYPGDFERQRELSAAVVDYEISPKLTKKVVASFKTSGNLTEAIVQARGYLAPDTLVRNKVVPQSGRNREKDIILGDSIALAYHGLELAFFRGTYAMPTPDANLNRPLPFKTSDRDKAWKMAEGGLPSPYLAGSKDNFLLRTREISDRVIARVLANTPLNRADALDVLDAAKRTVVADMSNGGLRYVRLTDDGQIDRILNIAISQELGRRQNGGDTTGVIHTDLRRTWVHLEAVRAHLPDISSPLERRALMLSTLFQISSFAIASVIKRDQSATEQRLYDLISGLGGIRE
jgi:hypothetical protein